MYPVTVIIPHYNEPLLRLILTVLSAQKAGAAEIVVVDDGSDTPPTTVAVRLVQQKHRGIAAALNLGLACTQQPRVCWLSVGDLMHPDKLGQQIDANAPATWHDYVDLTTGANRVADPNWRVRLWYDNQFCLSTAMVSRAVIDRIGGWDERLRYCVDWDFALRVEQYAGWARLDGVWGSAAEYLDGHTQRGQSDPRRQEDKKRVTEWARANEFEWARARGLTQC